MARKTRTRKPSTQKPGVHSGRSKSQHHPNGVRRQDVAGNELAPHHMRRLGRWLLKNCTDVELMASGITR